MCLVKRCERVKLLRGLSPSGAAGTASDTILASYCAPASNIPFGVMAVLDAPVIASAPNIRMRALEVLQQSLPVEAQALVAKDGEGVRVAGCLVVWTVVDRKLLTVVVPSSVHGLDAKGARSCDEETGQRQLYIATYRSQMLEA